MKKPVLILVLFIFFVRCEKNQIGKPTYYLGADLSYVNEMLDCNGEFRSEGKIINPYQLFADKGADIIRVRLWHNPTWTNYSNFEDVKKTIEQAKNYNMNVLLDFHYSDTWADPSKQLIPQAWADIEDLNVLGDSIYNYTYNTLYKLYNLDLLPEFVQVGNEINSEILLDVTAEEHGNPIDWERNSFLLNKGLKAVRDISDVTNSDIQSMLHIAQPENALWWFKEAFENQLTNFDWIGLSYYPSWSEYSINELETAIDSLIKTYNKRLMIVETAYPHGFNNIDGASNILGESALITGYPATPVGQLSYMKKLTDVVIKSGGEGVIYWEPAWISTSCSTLWGQGSHWENATFFDEMNHNEALEAFEFYKHNYKK